MQEVFKFICGVFQHGYCYNALSNVVSSVGLQDLYPMGNLLSSHDTHGNTLRCYWRNKSNGRILADMGTLNTFDFDDFLCWFGICDAFHSLALLTLIIW